MQRCIELLAASKRTLVVEASVGTLAMHCFLSCLWLQPALQWLANTGIFSAVSEAHCAAHCLCCPGTGKSAYIGRHLVQGLPRDAWAPTMVTLSARTSAAMMQEQVLRTPIAVASEGCCECSSSNQPTCRSRSCERPSPIVPIAVASEACCECSADGPHAGAGLVSAPYPHCCGNGSWTELSQRMEPQPALAGTVPYFPLSCAIELGSLVLTLATSTPTCRPQGWEDFFR